MTGFPPEFIPDSMQGGNDKGTKTCGFFDISGEMDEQQLVIPGGEYVRAPGSKL